MMVGPGPNLAGGLATRDSETCCPAEKPCRPPDGLGARYGCRVHVSCGSGNVMNCPVMLRIGFGPWNVGANTDQYGWVDIWAGSYLFDCDIAFAVDGDGECSSDPPPQLPHHFVGHSGTVSGPGNVYIAADIA